MFARDARDARDARLAMTEDGLAHAVAIRVDAHERPAVLPLHGLKVDDAAVRLCFLEVDEPPFLSIGRVDERALVRAVDGRGALLEDDLRLVRTVDVARAE